MSMIKQFFKNIGYIGIANAAVAVKGLLLIPIIVKSLGESDFGIWAQLLVTLYLLLPFATLHLGMAFIRFVSGKTRIKDISTNFSTILLIVIIWSSIISLAMVASSTYFLSYLIDLSEFSELILMLALILPLWSINLILFSYFRTRQKFKSYAGFSVLHNAAEIVFIACLISIGFGIHGAVLGLAYTFMFINVLLFSVIVSEIGLSRPDTSFLSKYLAYALPLVPLELFWWIADSSDKYITGYYLGAFSVGIYAAVYGLSRVVNMFAIPLTFVLGPTLAKFYDSGKMDQVKTLLGISLRVFIMFAVPIVVGFTVLAKPLLLLLATEDVSDGGYMLVPLITAGMLVYGISAIFSQVINLVKKTYIAGIVWGFAAGLNIILNIMLIPIIGLIGPAISTFFTFGFASTVIIYYTRRHLIFGFSWHFMGKCTLAGVLMGVPLWIILGLTGFGLVPTLLLIGLGAGVYFGSLYLLKAFGEKEMVLLRSFFSR